MKPSRLHIAYSASKGKICTNIPSLLGLFVPYKRFERTVIDMDLTQYKVIDFVKLMGSDAPAPGGGSASAMAGAMGAGLGAMVAGLTVGKAKFADSQELMEKIIKQATELMESLTKCVDEDTEAFNGVSAVFAMPKATDEEKAARKEAMEAALKNATLVPFHVIGYAHEALLLIKQAVGCSNPNTASDLGVAALTLKAAVQGAWLNVLINLPGVKDSSFVEQYKRDGARLVEEACAVADGIYQAVLESL